MVSDKQKRERNLVFLRAMKSFSQFSGEENLIHGLRLSSISIKIVQEVVKRIIDDDWRQMKAQS
jgi:hypothetical protein